MIDMTSTYIYKARTKTGEAVKGELKAPDVKNVVEYLWKMNYFIVDIDEKPEPLIGRITLPELGLNKKLTLGLRKKIKPKDLASFCRQFSILLNSGVPMLSCLNLLEQQRSSPRLQLATGKLIEELEQGNSIAEGAKKSPDVFPQLFINMVEAGELSGSLDEVLIRLANHYEREHELNEKVKTAMTYPLVIMVIALVCIGFLLGYVLPKFTGIFANFRVELPLMTRVVMAASGVVQKYWYAFLLLPLLAGSFIKKKVKEEKYKRRLDKLILSVPVLGDILLKQEISRFTRTMATLLRSGVNILQCLEIAKRVTNNLLIKGFFDAAQDSIKDGQGLAEPLEKSVFPLIVVQMIRTGEETGNLEEMLERVSGFYDQEIEVKVSRLSSVIEPVFIATLGLTVGFVLMAVLLPIFKVATSVQ